MDLSVIVWRLAGGADGDELRHDGAELLRSETLVFRIGGLVERDVPFAATRIFARRPNATEGGRVGGLVCCAADGGFEARFGSWHVRHGRLFGIFDRRNGGRLVVGRK